MPAGRRRAAGRSSKRREVGALSWHSAASSARAACVACRPCRCAFQSRKIPRPTDLLRALRDSPRREWEAGVRHGTGDPAPAFLALYRKSSVPYYCNWCSSPSYPVASTGIAKYSAPACRGLLYSPVRLPCCSWPLGTEEPCPALSNWCFALIPLAGLRPELARWLQRAAVNPVPHLWVLERINLLAVQAFKGGNLLVLNRQSARLSALGTRRSQLIGHRRSRMKIRRFHQSTKV